MFDMCSFFKIHSSSSALSFAFVLWNIFLKVKNLTRGVRGYRRSIGYEE